MAIRVFWIGHRDVASAPDAGGHRHVPDELHLSRFRSYRDRRAAKYLSAWSGLPRSASFDSTLGANPLMRAAPFVMINGCRNVAICGPGTWVLPDEIPTAQKG
jgi:hypothetical protein